MNTYVGIDLSLVATGIVAVGFGELQRTIRTTPETKFPERLSIISDAIEDVIMTAQPEVIAMESVAMMGTRDLKLPMVHGAVLMGLHRQGIRTPLYVAPATLKKFATGRGNGEKSDVKMFVFQKWGVMLSDNNQADAYVLAKIAQAIGDPELPWLKYEQECVDTILTSPLNGGPKR